MKTLFLFGFSALLLTSVLANAQPLSTIADAEVKFVEIRGDLKYNRFEIHGRDGASGRARADYMKICAFVSEGQRVAITQLLMATHLQRTNTLSIYNEPVRGGRHAERCISGVATQR